MAVFLFVMSEMTASLNILKSQNQLKDFLILVQANQFELSVNVRVLLQGDVNGDCKVNISDLAMVGICYGQNAEGSCAAADVRVDGKIDIFDLATVGKNYGRSC